MAISDGWRAWFPVPTGDGGIDLGEWLLLDGNRSAVTAALLTVTFLSMLGIGTVWTFEMQRLLTETEAVQTLLNTLLSGIILLVSIVVSINSIVLSYQITPLSSQEERIDDALDFRREIGALTDSERSPTDPNSFLSTMAAVIRQRAQRVAAESDGVDEAVAEDITAFAEDVVDTTEDLERSLDRVGGGQFGVLWTGLETDYSGAMDRSRMLTTTHAGDITDGTSTSLEDLVSAFELFSTGREYFKTLYYSQEVSVLSRRLLIISLPAIVVTASAILAIDAGLLPDVWLFGLPPLVTFVAATFAVALSPFLVLTAHMLRLTTVSIRTSAVGPFALRA